MMDTRVVVTGASSGIGRATALAFAREAASLVLVARREDLLRRLADECEAEGGSATVVPADVSDEAAMGRLAEVAAGPEGRIDVWVNNAAVSLYAPFGEEPFPELRRLVEVNVLGTSLASRAALLRFRDQGEGVLINVGSVLSRLPGPHQAGYVATQHAIRGLSASIRAEVADVPGIHVSTVMPGSVDTPLFDHAANHTGWAPRPTSPTSTPECVARAIVRCARHPRREVMVGWDARLAGVLDRCVPGMAERIVGRRVRSGQFTDEPADPTSGNLFQPTSDGEAASGGWRQGSTAVARRVAVAGLAVAMAIAARGRGT